MPAKKFRFVSPGVQIKEIDKSQLPASPDAIGPVVIGRTVRGPGMVPVTVGSYEEFVDKFGAPDRGAGSTDVWRNGNTTAPTYAAYAAEAWLKNSTPLTMVRLLGTQHETAIAGQGDAGWATQNVSASATFSHNGGAYGLFVIPSSSLGGTYIDITGSLAAVFYVNEGSLKLSGSLADGTDAAESSALIKSVGDFEYKLIVSSSSSSKEIQFNFDRSSAKHIRKVFNTNPTLVNKDVTPAASTQSYWLGETFETHLKANVDNTNGTLAMLAPLNSGSVKLANFKGVEAQPGKSGWVIGQDLNPLASSFVPADMPKLFRFVASEGLGGDWEQNNIKISIADIKYSNNEYEQYGTFTVLVRKIGDTDAAPEVIEAFTNCNLNPKSANYIAAKIGDRHLEWDKTEKRHKELGEYPNMSRYIRVEMNPVIEQGGLDPELLPFGFFGPPKFVSGVLTETSADELGDSPIEIATNDPEASGATLNAGGIATLEALLDFPSMQLRVSASDAGTLAENQAYFGVVPNLTINGNTLPRVSDDFKDLTRAKPFKVDSYEVSDADKAVENSFIFTLDDVVITGSLESGSLVYWQKDSRASGLSFTAIESGSEDWSSGQSVEVKEDYSYKDLVDLEFNKFTLPLFGGTDGLDLTEREPFRNSLITTDKTERTSSPLYTLRRAVDSIKDPEVLNMNLLVLPGITARGVTKYAIDTCESRGDAMAIVDLEGGYEPSSESDKKENERLGSVSSTVSKIGERNLNSSYACAYYPWVKVLDSENGFPLWMPPSVVALGTMASSQENSQIWFAPAGFNRGGLSLGSSGLSVVGVREKLTAKQRDALYDVNVNPIASFPSEGIVIFGQKTLQAVPSALDRINVRRLVIFLKKQISIVASGLLFEPNVQNTWDRFKRPVTSILEGVKNGLGISDYKLVLDSTTTTPEEIDRNMMYAKLFIKPVYAIEFIGIDFIITNTGASFEDL